MIILDLKYHIRDKSSSNPKLIQHFINIQFDSVPALQEIKVR